MCHLRSTAIHKISMQILNVHSSFTSLVLVVVEAAMKPGLPVRWSPFVVPEIVLDFALIIQNLMAQEVVSG